MGSNSGNPKVYQFPMEKVKRCSQEDFGNSCKVSIPYGKGKGETNGLWGKAFAYQFPMGKVKIDEVKEFADALSINPLWER